MTPADPSPLASVLLGAAISLGTTISTTVFLDYLRHRRESRNLAFAFRGEICALLTIISERGYIQLLEKLVRENTAAAIPFGLLVHVRREYFPVYVRNVDKIGALKSPLPESIATFYTIGNSILEDLQTVRETPPTGVLREDAIRSAEELLRLFQQATQRGASIRDEIDRLYGSSGAVSCGNR